MAFVRYTLTGSFATGVQYLVLVALAEALGFAPWLAAAIGAACGSLAAYAGNRRFTFRSRRPDASALPRFLLVAALGAAFNGGLVWLGVAAFGWHYLAAQLGATFLVLVVGYRVNRVWTFA